MVLAYTDRHTYTYFHIYFLYQAYKTFLSLDKVDECLALQLGGHFPQLKDQQKTQKYKNYNTKHIE